MSSESSNLISSESIISVDIKCPANHNIYTACTNQKCLAFPFLCQNTKNCHKCQENHKECITFIRFQKLLNEIYSKKNKPQKVTQFLKVSLHKWIDLITQNLQNLNKSLDSYGLTEKQSSFLRILQAKQYQKIKSSQLSQISRQICLDEVQANSQIQLLESLQKQLKNSTQLLQKSLSRIKSVIHSSKQGKLTHHSYASQYLSPKWHFDHIYNESPNFLFQHNDTWITKSADQGKYHHTIGNKKFNAQGDCQFSVMIKESKQRYLMFGIGTNTVQRNDAHYSNQCISYWGFNGTIWKNGNNYMGGESLKPGDIVTIKLQREHHRVVWMKNHKILAHSQLPDNLLKKDLYPLYGLVSNGDKLAVFDEI